MPHSWHIAYHSGMSSQSDLRAAIDEHVAVGLVANRISLCARLRSLPNYLNAGGQVFVDSGAFEARRKGIQLDWEVVFQAYEVILNMTDRPQGLSIVAPDVIGDQIETLHLWQRYSLRVQTWIDAGVRVIVPLQRGNLSAGEMLELAKRIFQRDRFTAGIPSNLDAMSPNDCATLFHHDFHILGRVAINEELQLKLDSLLANNPSARYTADANWMRSRISKIAKAVPQIHDPLKHRFASRRTRAVRAVLQEEAYSYFERFLNSVVQ